MKRPLTVVAATGGILAIGSASAFAAWLAIGSGNATVGAGTLPAPTGGSAVAAGPGKLSLSWTAPSPTPSSYVVTNTTAGAPGCTSTVPSCTIEDLAEATTYSFTVVAKLGGWESPASAPFSGTSGQTDRVTIDSVTPSTLALTDPSTVVRWHANVNGTYSVRVGGTSCDTGTQVASGGGEYTTQPATVDTTILRTELADGANTVRVCVGAVSASTTVSKTAAAVDTTGPTNVFSIESATRAFLSGTTLYYKSNAAGSFVLVNSMTDSESGPASTTFPAMTSGGWTHATEIVATPVGGPYKSSPYSWTSGPVSPSAAERTITGRDVASNSTATVLSFTADVTAPVGGSISGTASGTTITVSITAPTDAGSGVKAGSVTYERQRTNWNSGQNECSTFGNGSTETVTLTDNQDTGLTAGSCYRYRVASVSDNVGNVNTTHAYGDAIRVN